MGKINYSPEELYKRLSRSVIGQDDYKKKLSNCIWLHKQRTLAESILGEIGTLQKHNLLVVGPTGSGKTLAVNLLAEMFGMDVYVTNASEYTGSGWRGHDIEDLFRGLFLHVEHSTSRAEHAIIVLDEIDKMLQHGDYKERSFSAEHDFLKVIEGTKVDFKVNDRPIRLNTTGMLFIAGGAFEGIEEITKNRLTPKGKIGFATEATAEKDEMKSYYSKVTREDLVKLGCGRQFLGRFADIAFLEPLEEDDLADILLKSDKSVVTSLNRLLEATRNVHVEIDEAGAKAVAKAAIQEGTGARSLSQIITPSLEDAIFNIREMGSDSIIRITSDEEGRVIVEREISELSKNLQEELERKKTRIQCAPKKNRIENLADYILSASDEVVDANMREIRAAHALICSVLLYVLLECNPDEHTMNSVCKLLNYITNPEEDKEDSVFEFLIAQKTMDYSFYYDKFIHLDPTKKTAPLALNAAKKFSAKPKYKLRELG